MKYETCNKKGLWLFLLPLLWMLLIYAFSAQTAAESDLTSGSFIGFFARLFGGRFSALSPSEQAAFIAAYQSAARIIGHIGAFAVLGFLFALALALSFIGLKGLRLVGLSVLLSLGYALFDEIHQLFVEGRAFQFSDILCDAFGAFLGAGCLLVLLQLFKSWKKRQKRKNE